MLILFHVFYFAPNWINKWFDSKQIIQSLLCAASTNWNVETWLNRGKLTIFILRSKNVCVWQRTRRKFSFVRSTHTHTWWTVRRSPCVPGQEERRINLYHQIWSVGSRCVVHRRLMEYEDIAKQVLAASQLSSCSLRVSCFESPWFNILGWFGCNKYSSHHQEWWTTPWVLNLWLNRKRPFIFFM